MEGRSEHGTSWTAWWCLGDPRVRSAVIALEPQSRYPAGDLVHVSAVSGDRGGGERAGKALG